MLLRLAVELLASQRRRGASIDVDGRAGDEPRPCREEEGDDGCSLVALTEPAQWNSASCGDVGEVLVKGRLRSAQSPAVLVLPGADKPDADGVDKNLVTGELL